MVHLLAIAGRLGVELKLDDFDRLGSRMPHLVNLMPSGEYLMEDFFYAGGLPAVIQELEEHLHMDTLTVTGKTLGENTSGCPMLQPSGHRRDRQAAQGGSRDRRAPGQPLPGWGDYQTIGRLARTYAALRTSRGVRKYRRL